LLIASNLEVSPSVVDVFVAPVGEGTDAPALVLARDARRAGLRCEVDTRKASMKAMLRRANALGARVCLIVGDREVAEGVVELKDLASQVQEKVARADVVARAAAVVGSPAPPPQEGGA
jgi:histidyl-tRNA synthetase